LHEWHSRLPVVMVMAGHVIADSVQNLVMRLDENLRTTSVVRLEQARYERSKRVSAQDDQSDNHECFALNPHGVFGCLTLCVRRAGHLTFYKQQDETRHRLHAVVSLSASHRQTSLNMNSSRLGGSSCMSPKL